MSLGLPEGASKFSLSLYPINVKTAEPIGPKFVVQATCMTPRVIVLQFEKQHLNAKIFLEDGCEVP